MTDKDNLEQFLTDAGVGYKTQYHQLGTIIKCKEGMAKVSGYLHFYTEFNFDTEGQLIDMGAYH